MTLENLMIGAIRKFRSMHPDAEIRSCYISEGSGRWQKWSNATFRIEYVLEQGGEYQETYVRVSS